MGAVQRLATVVVLGLVALASVLILYLADEPNRLDSQAEAQQHDAVERAVDTYLTQCIACHGPAGEGYTAPGEAGTGRIGAAIGGDTSGTALNQTGIQQTGPNAGKPWSDPNNPQFGSGLEGRANFIRNRIHTGLKAPNGTVLMPAFGQEYNGPLNDSQIDELVTMIQHVDWNEVYNKAIEANGGYPTPPPAPTATGQAAQPTQQPAPGGQQTTFEIDMVDIAFQPTELKIPANTDVTITAVNKGNLPHTFTVPGVADTGEVPAGQSVDVKVNLKPGTYDFHCAIPGHEAAGMVGKLIAEEGAAGGAAASPAAGGAAAPSGQATTVEVDMVDISFTPAEVRIPANTAVTIHAVNRGALPHTLTIPDVGDTGEVPAGASHDLQVNLPPGEYPFHCAIPGHEAAGMVGTLIVEEGGGAAASPGGTPAAAESGGGQSGAAAAPSGPVEVDMVDLAFNPTELTIPANTDVTIHAVNSGALPHTFTIPDVADTGEVAPGTSTDVKVNLPPGEYDFHCAVPGHEAAGMVGKLIVK